MADSAEATTAEPQNPPVDPGLGLRKGASPHEAATALSDRRRRVAANTAPPRDAAQEPPAEPEQKAEQTDETARDAAESQGAEAGVPDGADASQAQDGAEDTGAADFPTTLKGLAEALEVDYDDFANGLTVTRKIAGQDQEISVAEAVEGYLRQSDYSRRQNELADESRQKQAELDQTLERARQQIETAENWLGVIGNALQAGPNDAELAQLVNTDPERYHAEKARRDNLLGAYNHVVNEREKAAGQARQEADNAKAKAVEAEVQNLERMSRDKNSGIPSPRGENWPAFEGKIRQYLGSVGFADKDVASFLTPGNWNANQVRIISDAMYGQELRQKGAGAGKKVRNLPKVMKPGQPKDRQQSNADKINQARARLRRNNKGREGDWNAVALLRAQRSAQKGR